MEPDDTRALCLEPVDRRDVCQVRPTVARLAPRSCSWVNNTPLCGHPRDGCAGCFRLLAGVNDCPSGKTLCCLPPSGLVTFTEGCMGGNEPGPLPPSQAQ